MLNQLKNKDAVANYFNDLKLLLGINDQEMKTYLGHIPKDATLKPHQYFCNEDGRLLYDGHLLFKERLREVFPDKDKRKEAEDALKAFLKRAFDKEEYPHPYYTILHADGDRMGAAIDKQAMNGFEAHQRLSLCLSKFAGKVKVIVEKNHEGSCVYAGGDDVLALLPLHTALQCARKLADEFRNDLKDFTDSEGNKPTLSVGLAVGHHLDPIQDTLALAREAEKIAKKQVPGKNALAVTVRKRSGADRTVKGSWDESKSDGALDCRLNRFVFLHLSDELPDAAAYELHDLALRLKPPKDASDDEKVILPQAQHAEARRILKRKQPKHGEEKTLADGVYEYLHGLLDSPGLSLEELANEIIVAREFEQAFKQAGIDHEKFARDNAITTNQEHVLEQGAGNDRQTLDNRAA